MKISYNWLKQFLAIDWEVEKTAVLLTDLGLEVEGIEVYESIKGGLEGVVVGHVLECEKHPNADRLNLTKVDIGTDAPVQIVCGATNVAKGLKVPVATIGTKLYDTDGNPWRIKKGKIRGEESHGMICAEDELGLGNNHDGIMILDEKLTPGMPARTVFEIEKDHVIEIGLTPNRADAMSHFGVARDLRAGLLQQNIDLPLIAPSTDHFKIDHRTLKIDTDIVAPDLCPRYCGVTISGITVKESPAWLQNRLKAIGLSPINNIVDATNYVLHDLGQPLHAFDASKIAGQKIVVKTVKNGTKFTTLDEVERDLHEDDLMICDVEKPLCIAGVFGGINSGVTNDTKSIFLESAYFDPIAIRKTAKRHGLNTDASFRFERGIDINNVENALMRATLLIQEIAGGEVTSDVSDVFSKKQDDYQVFLNYDKVTRLVGKEIPADTIRDILTSLEIRINSITETGMNLIIPPYRVDVQRDVDVIEEILRVYGYNNVEFTEKLNASISNTSRFDDHKVQDIIGNQLVSKGFYEMMSNSLTTPLYNTATDLIKDENNVEMLNPLSNDLAIMRQSCLFSCLEALAFNINRKNNDIKFFEFGKTYHKYNDTYEEQKHLSLIVSGLKTNVGWNSEKKQTNFFYVKGIVESILDRLGIASLKTKPVSSDIFGEGVALYSKKVKIVEFGTVKKNILKRFAIKQDTFFADFNWDAILNSIRENIIVFQEIPKFPEVHRDFALLIGKEVSFQEIYDIAYQSERTFLKNVQLFDVYEGENLPDGKKSYAISFTLLNKEQTLTDKQIDAIMNKLRQRFEKNLGAELR